MEGGGGVVGGDVDSVCWRGGGGRGLRDGQGEKGAGGEGGGGGTGDCEVVGLAYEDAELGSRGRGWLAFGREFSCY